MSGSKMDVVRLLTRRFRAQDIGAPSDTKATVLQIKEEAHDSGTGSDEELMAHVMPQSRPFERTNASEDQQHNAQVYDNPDSNRSRDSCRQLSTSLGHSSPVSLSPVDFHCLAGGDFSVPFSAERHSSPTGSDFERSSLIGLEASTSLSDLGVECSSSSSSSSHEGEDLMAVNRKRPQLSDDSCIFSEDDDDEDDNDVEICELFGNDDDDDDDDDDDVLGSRRCRRRTVVPVGSSSSPTFLSTIPFAGRGVSPQKRCRHDAGHITLRPNLDFYKMQKTSFVRRHCSINRPRPTKLMALHGSQGQKSNATFVPSSFTFRSLEFN